MKGKKLLSLLSAAVLATSSCVAFSACTPRSQVLKIFNWGDYIEDSLIESFESWYKTETGETIKVEYDTYDTNETMIMRIETQKADYDLVCPSEYMAERMITSELVQKVDPQIFDMSDMSMFYDGLDDMIAPFDGNHEYFVPYIWGTFGIMYDVNHIAAGSEELNSWNALWSDKWKNESGKNRTLMKDSVRDAYSVARIYANQEMLSTLSNGFTDYNEQYRNELVSYFSQVTDDMIKQAQDVLVKQKSVVCKYEVDDGKNDMLAGTTDAWLGFFWSCDAELIMNEEGGNHFYYTVPKEGSNVWVDGWLIPKYAQNTKAANYFLKFINTHEYAATNFEWIGESSALKSVMDEAKEKIENDESFEDGYYSGYKDMYLEMMFPSQDTLNRCGIMRDFGIKKNTELDSMWIDVKTI